MFDLVDGAAQVEAIQKMANTLSAALENRIEPVSVILRAAADMPSRSDGGPAFGFWKVGQRAIWLWDEIDEYPVAKTLAHEAMHVLDTDWLRRDQRRKLMDLMVPSPAGWGDQKINGIVRRYVALPSEVFAVYASAAIAGFEKPAYRRLFVRRVAVADWPALRELTLNHDGPPEKEVDDVEAVPTPPDPMAELHAQLLAAQAQVAEALAAKDAAELALVACESRLLKAKNKSAEISAL